MRLGIWRDMAWCGKAGILSRTEEVLMLVLPDRKCGRPAPGVLS